jgi:aminoglycoside phosphotransferase family enzyme/predicted kinase
LGRQVNSEVDQSEVIAFLSAPGTYGISGPVERIDTHAAIIFLAGERVYKLKRAVRLPFLDFSTSQKRQAVCKTELALNAHTAPGLYCRVEAIGRKPDGRLALGSGVPVDWVLVMRRFPADCLFDAMAREHRLTRELVRVLADRIAEFHDCAQPVRGAGAARVRKVIEGNRVSMAALPAGILPVTDCDRLAERSLAVLAELAPLLDRRARTGHVRHCHGDLHLANICLWQGKPTLFDCLEFDAELATTDVLYDLAFLLMDLWQRGLQPEASLLFNRYCDMRDEGDGLAAMPLFLSMRAAVRAHVEASAAGRQNDPVMRKQKVDAALAYFAAAIALLERPRPRLIAIGGLSGSGKSTLAGKLAPRIGAAPGARWLRTDALRKRIAGVAPEERLPSAAYTRERNAAIYRKLVDDARLALVSGMPVIVDGVFADAAEREAMMKMAISNCVPFTGLWLEAPPTVLHERVHLRTGDASDADAAVVDRQLEYALGDLSGWIRISAEGSPGDVLARSIEAVCESAP